MARRGKFGRSGTSQNLTMLVYQIMKQQMQDELDAILTAYKTNMEAGMYQSQFNGQNVDGEFVISYYEQMLAGFPPGSTEYETVNSKLEQFRQQYQNDIENLVINSMNNGSKIDFGLLGSGFQNKGIAEVELVDVRSWADDRIQQLLADGDTTQADKLSSAVYIAGFKVEHDNKVAMVDKGDLSYGAYAKWLKGQLGSALDSGLTKSSEAYREILKLHANAVKQAKAEGEANARENVGDAVIKIAEPVNKAAQLLIESYLGGENPVMAQAVYDAMSEVSASSNAPYYDALKKLAELRQNGDQTFNAIMTSSGVEGAAEMFSEAVSDHNTAMLELKNNGLNGLSYQDRAYYSGLIAASHASGMSFISNSGVNFFTGAGRNAMEQFEADLNAAGSSVMTGSSGGTAAISGGHPNAVLGAFEKLGESLKSIGGSAAYPWLKTMTEGYISVDLDPDRLSGFDTNRDLKVDTTEFKATLASGQSNEQSLSDLLNGIIQSSGSLDAPVGRLNPESIVNMFVNSVYGQYQIESRGAIVVSDASGVVRVTESNNASFPNAMPFSMGEYGIVYALPADIVAKTDGDQTGPIDPGKVGGMNIVAYKYPGIGPSSANIGSADIMIRVNGQMSGGDGYKSQKSILVPFDTYRKVLQHIGIEVEAGSMINPQSDVLPQIIVRFDGQTMRNEQIQDFMSNVFTNPSSEFYVTKLKDDNGNAVAPEAAALNFSNPGFINPYGDSNATIESLFRLGRDGILSRVTKSLSEKAPGTPVSRESIIADIVSSLPGLGGGVQDTTIKDLIVNSETFQSRMNTLFPEFKAAPEQFQTQPSGYGRTPVVVPTAPAPSAVPGANPYMQTQSFIDGAFRKAGPMNPVKPNIPAASGSIKPVMPTSVPTLNPIKPTTPAPYKPPTTAATKMTPTGITGPAGTINKGYTRGIS